MSCVVRSYDFTSDWLVGRFTQTDPLVENRPFKHYVYGSNNPISRIDPMGLDDDNIWDWFLMAINPRTHWEFFTKDVPSVPDQDVKAWAKSQVAGTFKTAAEIQTLGILGKATAAWGGVSGFLGRNTLMGTTLAAEESTYRWAVDGQVPTLGGFAAEAGLYSLGGMTVEGTFVVVPRAYSVLRASIESPRLNPFNWRPAPGLNTNFFGLPSRLEYVGPEARAMRIVSPREAGVVRMTADPRHHVFLQADESFFMARGFKKDEIHLFTVELDKLMHEAVHLRAPGMRPGGWWREEMATRVTQLELILERTLSKEELIGVARDTMRHHNLGSLFSIPFR